MDGNPAGVLAGVKKASLSLARVAYFKAHYQVQFLSFHKS